MTSNTELPTEGQYIVAVSGGVDSAALLHMLVSQPNSNLRLRVAHVNHGLRPDAGRDERLVQELAASYDLPFHSTQLNLGSASEATARELRYQFLFDLLQKYQAKAIITAHHEDDRLETSFINTLRGSGRHGQAASFRRSRLQRPLLHHTKADLYDYARIHGLAWREDQTNQDRSIVRNFIRHELMPDYSKQHVALMKQQQSVNTSLDNHLAKAYYQFSTSEGLEIPRTWLALGSWPMLETFFHFVLRKIDPNHEYSRKQIEELVRFSKTATAGDQIRLTNSLKLSIGYDKVAIVLGAKPQLPVSGIELVPQTSVSFGRFRFIFGSFLDQGAVHIELPRGHYFIRPARPGDRVRTTAGTKKVQDIFVDQKVPRHLRPNWPIVTDSTDSILWLPKLAKDHKLVAAGEAGYHLIAEEI